MNILREEMNYYSINSYFDIEKILNGNEKNNGKAMIVVLSSGFSEEISSIHKKHVIIDKLCELQVLTVLVVDCFLSEKSFEFILSFDFCLATNQAVFSMNGIDEIDYFPKENLTYMLGKQFAKNLLDDAYINKWIDSTAIEASVCQFLKPILLRKEKNYIQLLKMYFNLYKSKNKIDQTQLQEKEITLFCELALLQ